MVERYPIGLRKGEEAAYAVEQVQLETSRRIAESFELISKSRSLIEATQQLIRYEPTSTNEEN